ncbi:MAG TPA: hypothetical protein VII16_12980, partial [Actinomycetes bacterium]
DKVAVPEIKQLVDVASFPDDAEFALGLGHSSPRPAGPRRLARRGLARRDLQQPNVIERDLGTAIERLRQEAPTRTDRLQFIRARRCPAAGARSAVG